MATSPEQRELALKLLREKGRLALREVESLLGWNRPHRMMNRVMAGHLGIPERQLKYLIHRQHEQVKDQERRGAERDATAIALAPHISQKLGFSICLPAGWQVIADSEEFVHLAEEYCEMMQRSEPERTSGRRVISPRRADVRHIKNVMDLRNRLQANREHEELKAEAERHARLERMTVSIFQAAPPDDHDEAFIEITKLRLDSPLTAMDLYNLDKRLAKSVPWGNRPRNGLVVDGLQGIVYYFVMKTGEVRPTYATYTNQPAFFNAYLADDPNGWILSCLCRCGEAYMETFHQYKPIFRRIIGSFRRLEIP
jgi:hypothetical protein